MGEGFRTADVDGELPVPHRLKAVSSLGGVRALNELNALRWVPLAEHAGL